MEEVKIVDYARRLYQAHGDKAEFEAAQKASAYESDGDEDNAELWRKIRVAVREMRV